MISIHILYLILPNVFCLGYRLSGIKSKKNNVHFSKRKHIEHTNAVPIKAYALEDSTDDVFETNTNKYGVIVKQDRSKKKSPHSPVVAAPVYGAPNCHAQYESPPSYCQHVHLHFNATTRGDGRTGWRMPCLSIFLLIIIIVLVLNCFHYNYELGVNYVNMEDEQLSDDETYVNNNHRTDCLLDLNNVR